MSERPFQTEGDVEAKEPDATPSAPLSQPPSRFEYHAPPRSKKPAGVSSSAPPGLPAPPGAGPPVFGVRASCSLPYCEIELARLLAQLRSHYPAAAYQPATVARRAAGAEVAELETRFRERRSGSWHDCTAESRDGRAKLPPTSWTRGLAAKVCRSIAWTAFAGVSRHGPAESVGFSGGRGRRGDRVAAFGIRARRTWCTLRQRPRNGSGATRDANDDIGVLAEPKSVRR